MFLCGLFSILRAEIVKRSKHMLCNAYAQGVLLKYNICEKINNLRQVWFQNSSGLTYSLVCPHLSYHCRGSIGFRNSLVLSTVDEILLYLLPFVT